MTNSTKETGKIFDTLTVREYRTKCAFFYGYMKCLEEKENREIAIEEFKEIWDSIDKKDYIGFS